MSDNPDCFAGGISPLSFGLKLKSETRRAFTNICTEDDRMEIPSLLTIQAALDALRTQQHNLQETIGRLLQLMKTLPEGGNPEQAAG
jgi:hypothetical protein